MNLVKLENELFICLGFIVPYLIFLMRGGPTYYFYWIPMLVFVAMIIGMIPQQFMIISSYLKPHVHEKEINSIQKIGNGIIIVGLICFIAFPFDFAPYLQKVNQDQFELYSYVLNNLPKTAVYSTNGYFLTEFQEAGYQHMYLFWQVLSDDPVVNAVVKGNWQNINYFIIDNNTYNILTSPAWVADNVSIQALYHSQIIQSFNYLGDYIYIFQVNTI